MNSMNIEKIFLCGILRPELLLGVVTSVTARTVGVNLSEAGKISGSHYLGARYGRGEVGEFVLIEGQQGLLLGRITEIKLREPERRSLTRDYSDNTELDALGLIQLLGWIAMDSLRITAGVEKYPRLGDRIYAAPHQLIAKIPQLMESTEGEEASPVMLSLGTIDVALESFVAVRPEKLFGRHAAILGTTGGGKSWTIARIIEECLKFQSKIILIDATGEYSRFSGDHVVHCHLGEPRATANNSIPSSLPPNSFTESDFVALFEPSGKVQGPKLRAAIRSLRLAKLRPDLAKEGFIKKINQPKADIEQTERDPTIAKKLDDPTQEFDVQYLVKQIEQECVYPEGFGSKKGERDPTKWGGEDGSFSHCLSLVARINAVLNSPAYACVFQTEGKTSLVETISQFNNNKSEKLLRICLSGISYEYNAREVIANVIGRHLMKEARANKFRECPLVVMLDEAHNFLGRHIGAEDYQSRLDAFEIIAREGRKYGLSICLASQRPRDITEGVLSQMGTLIVHRLTNDKDRETVERACGEIDGVALAFLPNLLPGEAAIIGTDFPIPLTIRITSPTVRPLSDGPSFQKSWAPDAKETNR